MELKPSIILIFILSLFFLLTLPGFSRGRLDVSNMDSGIYDIDYRGPETHSSIPPPNWHGGRPNVHGESVTAHRKSKGLRAGNAGLSGKKIHG